MYNDQVIMGTLSGPLDLNNYTAWTSKTAVIAYAASTTYTDYTV